MSRFTTLVPAPADSAVNGKASPCPTNFLVDRYGLPRAVLTGDCQPVTSEFWKVRMVTEDVGPFRMTGHRLAVALFRQAFTAVKDRNPALYAVLGSAGGLCCRGVKLRGRVLTDRVSNHGLGLALDVKIEGRLDVQGDGKVFQGLLDLYAILKDFGFYWGVEFGLEDAMHFEVSAEVVMKWVREGKF